MRVVVPSRSLREHVSARLVRHLGGAVAGVVVQTLPGLVREILERAGVEPPGHEGLVPILVRRRARELAALAPLRPLEEGYGGVEAAVADFLDAGLAPAGAEALAERIAASGAHAEQRGRALALLRIAADCGRAVEAGVARHASRSFAEAAAHLARDPQAALPGRAILLHGFSDATGVQADLLEALVRHARARVFLDRPPDPSDPSREDPGVAFGARLAARLEGLAAVAPRPAREPRPRARIAVLHAPGLQAEARAVAARVRALLDAGAAPEGIAIVARDPARHVLPLRLHLGRLGIPFSGLDEPGPATPVSRRLAALLDLLRRGPRTPAERWLDALQALPGSRASLGDRRRGDLRLAFHARGAARLADVAALAGAPRRAVSLPVRAGLAAGEEGSRAPRRSVSGASFAAATAAAAALCARLAPAPETDTLEGHVRALVQLARAALGWLPDAPETLALSVLTEVAAGAMLAVSRDEARLFVERGLADAGRAPLGGAGGGVQVLSVLAARARTFDHLFAIGLERDVFPRPIREDPLLPDALRLELRDVLPDLPVKSEGHDEERFLFAQLLASSPDVTLSCAVTDDDGLARPPSPFLEGAGGAAGAPEPVPTLQARAPADARAGTALRPAHEYALLAGLHAPRARFAELFAVAAAEVVDVLATPRDAVALARARLAILEELDPRDARRAAVGPYLGFVGAASDPADPRRGPLHVTAAEGVAACPWQAFLGRLLRLELPPDALDALPSPEPRSVGRVVHAVLERIVSGVLREPVSDLAAAARRDPVRVPWPAEAAFEGLLRECAAEVAREEGIGIPGFERLLAARARPLLAVARDYEWSGGAGVPAVGVEVSGSVALRVPGAGERRLHFRADRVDRVGEALVLTDYKTGAAFSTARGAGTREAKHQEKIARGEALQAAAYAVAAARIGAKAEGRYLFLRPDLEPGWRVAAAGADAVAEELAEAAAAIFDVVETGSFFPRLETAGGVEPYRCQRCEVRDACLRGDSGARARLASWARAAAEVPPRNAAERAAAALFQERGPRR